MKQPVPFFDPKDLRPHPELYRPTLRSRYACLSPIACLRHWAGVMPIRALKARWKAASDW